MDRSSVDSDDLSPVQRRGHGTTCLLSVGTDDRDIAADARHDDRLVLTQDDDFFTDLDVEPETAGILYQKDQTLSGKEVSDIVEEIATYLPQDEIVLEYVSKNWL